MCLSDICLSGLVLTRSSEIQYKRKLKEWNVGKNVRKGEMKAIVRKRQQRRLQEPSKRDLLFRVRNEVVPPEKIDRWMDRNKVAPDSLFCPSPEARRW